MLLAWGGALFLVRFEKAQLQLQRVHVDAEHKKVSLQTCSVLPGGDLPAKARLVAAQEVEDIELATRYPLLVLQDSGASDQRSSPASRKRRRSQKAEGDGTASTQSRAGGGLLFYALYETENDEEFGLRYLNTLEVPGHQEAAGAESDRESLQVFLTDGPNVLVFERTLQLATLLTQQVEGDSSRFCVLREKLRLVDDHEAVPVEVSSCTFVSETLSTRPHLLIHAQRLASSSTGGKQQIWSVLDLGGERADGELISKCHYLVSSPSTTEYDGDMSMLEEVTCCCFIPELGEWDFTAPSPTAALTAWNQGSRIRPNLTDVSASTLLVSGTTSNTVSVHTNGILLVSYVLPAPPAEIWCMCEDSMEQRYVLCLRCDDADRSLFMLGFSSKLQNASMELLLSFKRVGHAFAGDFAGMHSTQVLLLNDVPSVVDTNSRSHVVSSQSTEDGQLVKRSVLVMQKASAPETKLSCHRLRLLEAKKSKHVPRSRKRTRSDEKLTSKGDPTDSKSEPFRYIERTQKASSRDRSLTQLDELVDGEEESLAASHAQLGTLAASLFTRLESGLQELERLRMIVNDKTALAHQLNQLIIREWQKQQGTASPSNEHPLLLTHPSSREGDDPRSATQGLIDMETMVSAASRTTAVPAKAGLAEQVSIPLGDLKLDQQVSLQQFGVLEYVPSTSLLRAEVVLKNLSDQLLSDSFVVLTAPKGDVSPAQGWKCSCSVVPEFAATMSMADHSKQRPERVRYLVELQFAPGFTFLRARLPLELTLWLHWSANHNSNLSGATLDWRPSESSLAVASVKIHPEDLLRVNREPPAGGVDGWCGGRTIVQQDQEQLLFLSSGSDLAPWFREQSLRTASSPGAVIRPTFALVGLCGTSHELMLYELSRTIANLQSDVYVMLNPFRQDHLRVLQRVLRSMRLEIIAVQRRSSAAEGELASEKQKTKTHPLKADEASLHRAAQRNTDLHVNRLLHVLQKRVNFHTMWFDASAVAVASD